MATARPKNYLQEQRWRLAQSGGPTINPSAAAAAKDRAGVFSSVDPGAATRAMRGMGTKTTRQAATIGNRTVYGPEVKKAQSPMGEGDVAKAMFADLEAQEKAKEETRGIAEKALTDVKQSYGEAKDRLGGSLEASREAMLESRPTFEDMEGRFQKAWDVAEDVKGQAETAAEEQKDRVEEWREERQGEITDTFALRMSGAIRGLGKDLTTQMAAIDQAAARGDITARGGGSTAETAAAMKAQLRAQHADQLLGYSAQIGVQQAELTSKMNTMIDQYSLDSIATADKLAASTGLGTAGVMEGLLTAESNARRYFAEVDRQNQLSLVQGEIALAQLATREPELAADIRLSNAYLPSSTATYGSMKELFDMYQIQEIAANRIMGTGSMSTPSPYAGRAGVFGGKEINQNPTRSTKAAKGAAGKPASKPASIFGEWI